MLKLVLKKKWFDMISSGEKTEEYRELKPFYLNRLLSDAWGKKIDDKFVTDEPFLKKLKLILHNLSIGSDTEPIELKHNDVTFYLGYSKDRPSIVKKIENITIDKGKSEWGAEPNKEYFVIKLKD